MGLTEPYDLMDSLSQLADVSSYDISQKDEALYRKLSPINLTDKRLMNLAKGLAPAHVRVSGTWANATFFQEPNDTFENCRISKMNDEIDWSKVVVLGSFSNTSRINIIEENMKDSTIPSANPFIAAPFTVVRKEYITPHYLRIFLTGESVTEIAATTVGINNKIIIPPAGT